MREYLGILVVFVLSISIPGATAGFAADLGTPDISAPQISNDRFDTRKFLTGIRLEQSSRVILEPQVGLGHSMWEREARSGYDEITHKIHAHAGGKIELFNLVSLSAAAKIPVYTIESSDRRIAGTAFTQPGSRRYGYDILHSGSNLSWTGEMDFHLSEAASIDLFYDKNNFEVFPGSNGLGRFDERFGTRFIFRFR